MNTTVLIDLLHHKIKEKNLSTYQNDISLDNLTIKNEGHEDDIIIGNNAFWGSNTTIINQNGKLWIGENFKTGIGVNMMTYGGSITIGNNVVINNYSVVYGHGGLTIGDNTQVAAHCVIIPANHNYRRTDIPISRQGEKRAGIKIGSDVWIGANVTILDNIEIGAGSIIGAGSVVTKSIPPYTIAIGNPAKVNRIRCHENIITLQTIDSWLIDYVYESEHQKNIGIVNYILQYDASGIDFLDENERAFPADPAFLKTGYYKVMLKRYFFAGSFFCREKEILDSCSGLGWGTYILSQYASNVTAFDIENKAISFSRKNWPCKNVDWIVGSALDNLFEDNNRKFDVVTAFETIEHFTQTNGERYIRQMSLYLKDGGFIVGTSSFPITEEEAENLCNKNPNHHHIFTLSEMNDLLSKYFSEHTIIDNWMFVGKK